MRSECTETRYWGLVGALGLLWATAVSAQDIRIDEVVEVQLQQLYVTVSGAGERVLDLEKDDFRVRDRGEEQKIVTFARGNVPFTAVLLVDASGSMWGNRLEVALRGARAFTEGMGEKDEAKVMLAAERLVATTPFSGDPGELQSSLEGVTGGKGTAFRDQLYLSLLLLERRLGRRVIVLLSDGWDAHSVVTEEQLARLTRRSQALIYWVRVGSGEVVPGEAAIREGLGRARLRTAPLSVWRDARAFDGSVLKVRYLG